MFNVKQNANGKAMVSIPKWKDIITPMEYNLMV